MNNPAPHLTPEDIAEMRSVAEKADQLRERDQDDWYTRDLLRRYLKVWAEADLAFMAFVKPSKILALLSELESSRRQRPDMRGLRNQIADIINRDDSRHPEGICSYCDDSRESDRRKADAIIALAGEALAQRPDTRADGWQLVPTVPTAAMLQALFVLPDMVGGTIIRHSVDKLPDAYRAMLAAAPLAPSDGTP